MRGDYTRLTFDPRRDHAGVLMQQGRVQLDADWNELVELIDRRLRAETVDVVGRATVPRETPDGFRIQASGGSLTIGRGRMYVDGLLAENHGAAPDEWDAVLGEVRGTGAVAYDAQPYLPNPPALPADGPHLAYLDVWQREVTALEDPRLVEKAVGSDTATRLQTVWQVRLLENAGQDATCTSAIPGWDALTAPSAGRLTTRAIGVPASDDPCFVPPSGGYRGPENRLYRVEIHQGGPLGTATYKWSRDNGSVASAVEAMDTARTELTVTTLGRDGVLRFAVGDVVEIVDDVRELAGRPGELRTVAAVVDAAQTVELDTALPAGEFDPTDADRHTRIRRWDAAAQSVPTGGAAIALDPQAGVEITFTAEPTGGALRTGDYWVFAARTADASVEELDAAPPRGLVHHYARLALVTFPGTATDCRTLWPPESHDDCECSVCVSAESHNSGELTIQQALDRVKATGGKICLGAGVFRLDRGLVLQGGRAVRIQGRGWRTIVTGPGNEPALSVVSSVGVTIEDVTVITASLGRVAKATVGGTAIVLRNTVGATIQRCVLAQSGFVRGGVTRLTTGTRLVSPFGASRAGGGPAIGLEGLLLETTIRENVLVATTGLAGLTTRVRAELASLKAMVIDLPTARERAGRSSYLLTFGLVVQDNLLRCDRTGISLEGFALHLGETRLTGNTITGCTRGGLVATGVVAPGSRLDVRDNTVTVAGDAILVGTDDTLVAGNAIGRSLFGAPAPEQPPVIGRAAVATAAAPPGGAGIVLGPSLRPTGIDRCQVLANRIVGIGGAGIEMRARVVSALIGDNVVEGTGGGGIVTVENVQVDGLSIQGNQLLDVAAGARGDADVAAGIMLLSARRADIEGNTVAGVGRNAVQGAGRAGIAVRGAASVRIAGNEVVDVGPPQEFVREGLGIFVGSGFDRLDVVDNLVRRSQTRPEAPGSSQWLALRVGDPPKFVGVVVLADLGNVTVEPAPSPGPAPAPGPAPTNVSTIPITNVISRTVLKLGEAGLLVEGLADAVLVAGDVVHVLPRGREIVGVRGNLLEAYGGAPAAEVLGDGACVFSDNRCLLTSAEARPTARVRGRALIAGGNYVEGPPEAPGLQLGVPAAGTLTVLGNIASGSIQVNGAPLGAPWQPLNQTA